MKAEQTLRLKDSRSYIGKTYSGKLILRFTPENHEKVAELARKKSMSINLLLNIMIEDGLRKEYNREKRRASK
ncbi:MAG: toxin-antitoxin system HicB family antitoxin [Erysipelotrichaceae bacterium]|nr:toxin-antitoxin system HicB family antitoxin [Erysipelotrichaceae bacterium]